MDIKEIALRIGEEADEYADALLQSKGEYHPDWHTVRDEYFAEALIAELAKQNKPVLYAEFAEDGGWLGVASEYQDYLEEPHELYTSNQVAAAILKATKPLEERLSWLDYTEKMNKALVVEIEELHAQLAAAQEEGATVTSERDNLWFKLETAKAELADLRDQLAKAEQRVSEACSRTVYVQADQIKKLTAERDAALARLSEERDIWDRMLGDAADKFAHLEREIDDCLYVLDALWDKQCNKIVTQKWAEILIRNKRVTGASSAEDSSEPTSSE